MAFRYVLLFLLPIVLVWLIEYATFPLHKELHLKSRDLLNRALSQDPVASGELHLSNDFRDLSNASSRLNLLYSGCIFLGIVITSLLIPRRAEASTKANLLTVILAGFGICKLLDGLHHTSWPALTGVLLAGLATSIMIIGVRAHLQKRTKRP